MQIECKDNLDFMQKLQAESIDLIYCDILYGTGNDFGDYRDIKSIKSEIEKFYLPRIKEMERVLKNTGLIYLQMDTKISHWIRFIMDDVFGYNNFRNEIIWSYRNGGGISDNNFPKKHDTILRYSKSDEYIHNAPMRTMKGNGWRHDGTRYQPAVDETPIADVWDDISPLHANDKEKVYATQKPRELLYRIIETSSKENDIIADFFLGGGTTAVVCKELNRKFIGCDINIKAVEITNQRLNGTLF